MLVSVAATVALHGLCVEDRVHRDVAERCSERDTVGEHPVRAAQRRARTRGRRGGAEHRSAGADDDDQEQDATHRARLRTMTPTTSSTRAELVPVRYERTTADDLVAH